MPHDPSAEPRRPVVGRGEKVRTAVLAATMAELTERGYPTLTVDQIARRAGVHKTTVYRRWKDLDTLLVEALTEVIAADIPVPDSGSVATDLRLLARGLVAWITTPTARAVLATLLSDAVHLPEVTETRRRIFEDRIQRARPVVTRAIERGQLPPGTDAAELIRDLAAPIYFRVLITGEQVDTATADRAAANALAAALAAGADPAR